MSSSIPRPTAALNGTELRDSTVIRCATEEQFKRRGIKIGSSFIPEKLPPPPHSHPIHLKANLYEIHTEKSVAIFRFDLEIVMFLRNNRTISLTKKSDSTVIATDRKTKTRRVFKLLLDQHNRTFANSSGVFYDLESMLFATFEVVSDEEEEREFLIDVKEHQDAFPGVQSISVNFKRCKERYQIDLTDFEHLGRDVAAVDSSQKSFLEVVTSQIPFLSRDFVTLAGGICFDLREPETPLPRAKYLGNGFQKSVRYVEGADGQPKAAIAIDLKKTAFHAPGNALRYLAAQHKIEFPLRNQGKCFDDRSRYLSRALKGLKASIVYAPQNRIITIHDVTLISAHSKMIDLQCGRQMTVEAYLHTRYGVKLQYPLAPMAVEKRSDILAFYPLECLRILDNQKISGDVPQAVIKEMIEKAAVKPSDRVAQIEKAAESVRLFDNEFLRSVATEIAPDMMDVVGNRLQPPTMVYDNSVMIRAEGGSWRIDNRPAQFFKSVIIKRWSIVVMMPIENKSEYAAVGKQLETFTARFIKEGENRGLQIAPPIKPYIVAPGCDNAYELEVFMFESATKYDFEFVMVIMSKAFHEHKFLKYLERKYQIITQTVTDQTMLEINKNGAQMLQNVVMKTNIKLGGLNYNISMPTPNGAAAVLDADTMFVGIAMSHSKAPAIGVRKTGKSASRPPSVVGFAANVTTEHTAFIGDFIFQSGDRDEKVASIEQVVQSTLKRWAQHHDGRLPRRILFYRNGASEGQFANILKYEIPLIEHSVKQIARESNSSDAPAFAVLVCTKTHNVRFFKNQMNEHAEAKTQNVPAGTVVNSTVVHPVHPQFFLQAHAASRGTARPLKVDILHNACGFSLKQLEVLTFGLSHVHQVANCSTSLPTPAFVAGEYADRGMSVYGEFMKLPESHDVRHDDFNKLNRILSYGRLGDDSPFKNFRINA